MIKTVFWIARFVSAIAAMNWGFVIFFKFNLVDYIFNYISKPDWAKYLYGFIAICGFFVLLSLV